IVHLVFSLLVILSSPRSPLFPYTTLFRSAGPFDLTEGCIARQLSCGAHGRLLRRPNQLKREVRDPATGQRLPGARHPGVAVQDRSEEHTSELQSLAYLVCRLLLEKKKKLE